MKPYQLILGIILSLSFVITQSQSVLPAQISAIHTLGENKGYNRAELNSFVANTYGVSISGLSQNQASELITYLQSDKTLSLAEDELILAEILEVGMAKKFHLKDGNIIHGSIIEIDGELCVLETAEGVLNIPMSDILEETVDIIKNDNARYKGPLLQENGTTVVIRSKYGDVDINKKDIKKMDRYHGGKLIPWVENKKEFYQGEAQLTSVFLDPTAFPLEANTFYMSGLSIGYGFTDRFMVTTQFGSNFNGDLNLNPKMRFMHKKTSKQESATTWGMGFHRAYPIQKIVSNYSHAWKHASKSDSTLNQLGDFSIDSLNNFVKGDDRNVLVEAYLVYSSRRENPTGRGKVGYSVGFKTSNMFFLTEDEYTDSASGDKIVFDGDNSHFILPFRAWVSFEYDLQKKLKFVGSIWADNSSRTLNFSDVLSDYFGEDGSDAFSLDSMEGKYSMFDFDFGFLYAVNSNFRIGIHFQQPYIDIYWEFFEF